MDGDVRYVDGTEFVAGVASDPLCRGVLGLEIELVFECSEAIEEFVVGAVRVGHNGLNLLG